MYYAWNINLYQENVPVLYLLKTPEKLSFSYVFRRQKENIDLEWFNRKQYQLVFFVEFIFTNNLIVSRHVDDVHNMIDNISKQTDITNEITEAVSEPLYGEGESDEVCFTLWLTGKNMKIIAMIGFSVTNIRDPSQYRF